MFSLTPLFHKSLIVPVSIAFLRANAAPWFFGLSPRPSSFHALVTGPQVSLSAFTPAVLSTSKLPRILEQIGSEALTFSKEDIEEQLPPQCHGALDPASNTHECATHA